MRFSQSCSYCETDLMEDNCPNESCGGKLTNAVETDCEVLPENAPSTKTEVFNEPECVTPKSILSSLALVVAESTTCPPVKDEWLQFFNDAVMYVNIHASESIPTTGATLKKDGECEFNLPVNFNKMGTVGSEGQMCGSKRCPKVYHYVPLTQMANSCAYDIYTINGNKIEIHVDDGCGCGSKCPELLNINYRPKLTTAKSLDECIEIPEKSLMLIKNRIVADSLGILFQNVMSVQKAESNYNNLMTTITNYDGDIVATPRITKLPSFKM